MGRVEARSPALAAATERVRIGPLVACSGVLPARAAGEAGRHGRRDQRRATGVRHGRRLERDRVPRLRAAVRSARVARFEESFEIDPPPAGRRARHARRDGSATSRTRCCSRHRRTRVPLMVGSSGPRRAAPRRSPTPTPGTPGTTGTATPPRASRGERRIDARAPSAGRDPAEVERSACVLVVLDRRRANGRHRRRAAGRGRSAEIARALHDLARGRRRRGDPRARPDHRGQCAAVRRRARRTRRVATCRCRP